MDQNQQFDPWASASDPQAPKFENNYWGKVSIDAWTCALVKGAGKVPFDPNVHNRRATALDLTLTPLAEMNVTNASVLQYILERHIIAESAEWREYTWASAKAMGLIGAKDLSGVWAKITLVDTKETYEKNGETKTKQAWSFVTIFPDEASCRADYLSTNPTPAAPAQDPTQAPTNPNDPQRTAAYAFLKVIVPSTMKQMVGHPLDEAMEAVKAAIEKFPGVSKYFTIESEEVVKLMADQVF
jgi:hypothetical protein